MKFEVSKRTELEVVIHEKSWIIKRPTVTQLESVYEAIEAVQSGESKAKFSRIWTDFFESLGIGKESLAELETDDLMGLIDFVTSAKKKS
jgi:hypothetical protein